MMKFMISSKRSLALFFVLVLLAVLAGLWVKRGNEAPVSEHTSVLHEEYQGAEHPPPDKEVTQPATDLTPMETHDDEVEMPVERQLSPDPVARAAALKLRREDEDFIMMAAGMLRNDENSIIRAEALKALASVAGIDLTGEPIVPELAGRDDARATQARRGALDRNRMEMIYESFVSALEDPNPTIVRLAVMALGQFAEEDTAGVLVAYALKNQIRPDGYGPGIEMEAVASLGVIGSRNGTAYLLDYMSRETDYDPTAAVADALAGIRDPDALEALRARKAELLHNEPEHPMVRHVWERAVTSLQRAIEYTERGN